MLLGLTIVSSVLTICIMQALAHKKRWGWYVSLANQPLWVTIIILTHTWGLLILHGFMVVTAIQGIYKWRNDA